MALGKFGVWVIWLGSLWMIVEGSGWVTTAGLLAFWGTLMAHLLEFRVKRRVMEAAGGSMRHHLVQTLIYGLFHWKPLEDAAREQQSAGDASS